MKNNFLDQFYTNPMICKKLVDNIFSMFDLKDYYFIEPAIGTGNFVYHLLKKGVNKNRIKGYDIDPKCDFNFVKKCDFLKEKIKVINKRKTITITNPPFGKKCDLAIKFLNKSLEISDTVCVILPNTFNKFSIQSKIKQDAKLIYSISLPENAFIVNDKEYNVKCVFQIWTNPSIVTWLSDKRIKKNDLKIDELQLFIHNNTTKTLKYFNKKNINEIMQL